MCHKNVLGNVVHSRVTKAAVESLKARINSTLVFLIPKSDNEAECVVAIDASVFYGEGGYFSKMMPLDLKDLVFIGPEYRPIVEPITVLEIVRHLSLLRMCLGYI